MGSPRAAWGGPRRASADGDCPGLSEGGPGTTTGGGGAGSPEEAGQGSGRAFVGTEELQVGPLGRAGVGE